MGEGTLAQISVSELLVRCLKAEGVDLMAGIIDGAHIPIVVHTPKYGVRYINAHHEEAAVHIAEGYARVTRRPGVVIGNPACGTGNMLAGVVSAHGEGHPIVAPNSFIYSVKMGYLGTGLPFAIGAKLASPRRRARFRKTTGSAMAASSTWPSSSII